MKLTLGTLSDDDPLSRCLSATTITACSGSSRERPENLRDIDSSRWTRRGRARGRSACWIYLRAKVSAPTPRVRSSADRLALAAARRAARRGSSRRRVRGAVRVPSGREFQAVCRFHRTARAQCTDQHFVGRELRYYPIAPRSRACITLARSFADNRTTTGSAG